MNVSITLEIIVVHLKLLTPFQRRSEVQTKDPSTTFNYLLKTTRRETRKLFLSILKCCKQFNRILVSSSLKCRHSPIGFGDFLGWKEHQRVWVESSIRTSLGWYRIEQIELAQDWQGHSPNSSLNVLSHSILIFCSDVSALLIHYF